MLAFRFSVIVPLALMLAGLWNNAAFAQAYPTKPIRLLVPFPPGGPADILSRVVAKKLSEGLGQQMLIENRPGAGGTTAMETVAKSAPDGYTIGLGSNSTFAIAPSLYRKLGYDPFKSFAPISLIARSTSVIVINAAVPANSLREFIALAKTGSSRLNYGSNGNGTIPHLAGLLFQSMTGTKFVHVPYKGVAPMTNDLIAGQVQVGFIISAGLEQHVRAGKLKALAVAGSKRLPQLPDVPTAAEAGLRGFETYTWFGMAVPEGTPANVIQRINAELRRALAAKDVHDVLVSQGFEAEATTPEQFAQYISAEAEKWSPVVKASGMKVD
jgi:tripartite-type tricarboxylate transporter receptor subunit TctC